MTTDVVYGAIARATAHLSQLGADAVAFAAEKEAELVLRYELPTTPEGVLSVPTAEWRNHVEDTSRVFAELSRASISAVEEELRALNKSMRSELGVKVDEAASRAAERTRYLSQRTESKVENARKAALQEAQTILARERGAMAQELAQLRDEVSQLKVEAAERSHKSRKPRASPAASTPAERLSRSLSSSLLPPSWPSSPSSGDESGSGSEGEERARSSRAQLEELRSQLGTERREQVRLHESIGLLRVQLKRKEAAERAARESAETRAVELEALRAAHAELDKRAGQSALEAAEASRKAERYLADRIELKAQLKAAAEQQRLADASAAGGASVGDVAGAAMAHSALAKQRAEQLRGGAERGTATASTQTKPMPPPTRRASVGTPTSAGAAAAGRPSPAARVARRSSLSPSPSSTSPPSRAEASPVALAGKAAESSAQHDAPAPLRSAPTRTEAGTQCDAAVTTAARPAATTAEAGVQCGAAPAAEHERAPARAVTATADAGVQAALSPPLAAAAAAVPGTLAAPSPRAGPSPSAPGSPRRGFAEPRAHGGGGAHDTQPAAAAGARGASGECGESLAIAAAGVAEGSGRQVGGSMGPRRARPVRSAPVSRAATAASLTVGDGAHGALAAHVQLTSSAGDLEVRPAASATQAYAADERAAQSSASTPRDPASTSTSAQPHTNSRAPQPHRAYGLGRAASAERSRGPVADPYERAALKDGGSRSWRTALSEVNHSAGWGNSAAGFSTPARAGPGGVPAAQYEHMFGSGGGGAVGAARPPTASGSFKSFAQAAQHLPSPRDAAPPPPIQLTRSMSSATRRPLSTSASRRSSAGTERAGPSRASVASLCGLDVAVF